MPRIRAALQHVVPVRQNGHFAEIPVFIQHRSVVKCDAVPPVAFDQRRIQVIPVFIAEVALLQAVPDDKSRYFIRQHRIIAGGKPFEARVGIERFSADGHNIGAVRRGW